jgi:hypothetical protein
VFRSAPPRSRLAAKIERALNTLLGGDSRAVIDAKASELLGDAGSVAQVISAAMDQAGTSLAGHITIIQAFRRGGLESELLDSLGDRDPTVRVAGARLCAALRLPDAVPFLIDLMDDPNPAVRDVAVRSLGRIGGRRVVDALMAHADTLPRHRVVKELSRAASDIDLETLLRDTGNVKTTVTVVLASGLRGDALRTPLIVRMAQDRQCETEVRVAACRALGMIGDPSGADAMRLLASDPDASVKSAAVRARMRISTKMRKRAG